MYDHLDVEAAVTACRLLWHKTRQRAVRGSRSLCLQGSVMDLMAQMCGQPTPVFMKGLPDWKIISSTPSQLEATIRENPELYLNILLCHLLPDESALKRDFEKLCRRLGRDPVTVTFC